jgi:YHS domain-containing protein
MTYKSFLKILISVFLFIYSNYLAAQNKLAPEKNTIAFDGYDIISYFANKVVKGNQAFQTEYKGIKLVFETQENLQDFKSNPEKYFPKYGGWCAIAMADDAFMVPDYSYFKIQEGKLLFFRVKAFFNGLIQWNKSPNANLMKADVNYRNYFP